MNLFTIKIDDWSLVDILLGAAKQTALGTSSSSLSTLMKVFLTSELSQGASSYIGWRATWLSNTAFKLFSDIWSTTFQISLLHSFAIFPVRVFWTKIAAHFFYRSFFEARTFRPPVCMALPFIASNVQPGNLSFGHPLEQFIEGQTAKGTVLSLNAARTATMSRWSINSARKNGVSA